MPKKIFTQYQTYTNHWIAICRHRISNVMMSALSQYTATQHLADNNDVTVHHNRSRTWRVAMAEDNAHQHRGPPTTNCFGIEQTVADQGLGVGPPQGCRVGKTGECHLEHLYRFYEDTVADSVRYCNSRYLIIIIIIIIIIILLDNERMLNEQK